jgi:hypothetical protein
MIRFGYVSGCCALGAAPYRQITHEYREHAAFELAVEAVNRIRNLWPGELALVIERETGTVLYSRAGRAEK